MGYWTNYNNINIPVEPDEPNAVWIDGDYHLLANSPCIDAGDPNYMPQANEEDLDGNARLVGPAIDIGIFESK